MDLVCMILIDVSPSLKATYRPRRAAGNAFFHRAKGGAKLENHGSHRYHGWKLTDEHFRANAESKVLTTNHYPLPTIHCFPPIPTTGVFRSGGGYLAGYLPSRACSGCVGCSGDRRITTDPAVFDRCSIIGVLRCVTDMWDIPRKCSAGRRDPSRGPFRRR